MAIWHKPHASDWRMGFCFAQENLWKSGELQRKTSPVIHAFHIALSPPEGAVEKPGFCPQSFPSFPQDAGPYRPQTGFRNLLNSNKLGAPSSLSPQTVFAYNTETNS